MRILLATDAQWLVEEIVAVLGDDDTSFTVCADGRDVARQLAATPAWDHAYSIGIFDLQSGSMGGMAVTMALRLDASAGLVPQLPVLMLLDREADVHLARRSGADGWLIKPLDPLRLRRAVGTIVAGGTFTEGLPETEPANELNADAEVATA